MRISFRIIVILLLAAQFACVSDNDLKIELNMTPTEQNDGWEIESPTVAGLDVTKLNALYEEVFSEQDFIMAYSFLVVRNDKLVAEGYTKDLADINRLVQIESVTKSVLSLVFGIFLDENPGIIASILDPIKPEYIGKDHFDGVQEKQLITIENLLTMRSGLAFDNGSDTKKMILSTSQKMPQYILSRSLQYDPGSTFNFSDGDAQLVADILFKLIPSSGLDFDSYIYEKLLKPLEIEDFIWEKHAWDTARPLGAFGLYLKPRDLAKLGRLVLNRGEWNGVQVVPEQWVIDATSSQVAVDEGGYGYFWWVRNFGVMAYGEGGQVVYIVPDRELVIVMTANPFSEGFGISKEKIESVVTRVIAAIDDESS